MNLPIFIALLFLAEIARCINVIVAMQSTVSATPADEFSNDRSIFP